MRGAARLWLVGGLIFVVGMVLFFPARVAYHWLSPEVIKVAGINGSLWNGNAAEAWLGGFYFRDLRWRIRPAQLLTGKLGYSLEAKPARGFVEGNVAVSAGGTLTLATVSASVPLELLRPMLNNPGLAGALNVQIAEAELRDGIPVSGEGTFEIANMVDPRIHPGSIGGYRGRATSNESGVDVVYEDTDGLIDIDGHINVQNNGRFIHSARLRAKNTTPERFRQFIDALPLAEDGSDWHEYVLGEGQL